MHAFSGSIEANLDPSTPRQLARIIKNRRLQPLDKGP
jgi:hypothetical protein